MGNIVYTDTEVNTIGVEPPPASRRLVPIARTPFYVNPTAAGIQSNSGGKV